MPSYVHSDRRSSLISEKLKQFFSGRGTATSRTSRYNPQGNGQCEHYNRIVWKAVTLALKTRSLSISQWEEVLPGCSPLNTFSFIYCYKLYTL